MIFKNCKRFGDDDLPARISNFEYIQLSNRPEAAEVRKLLNSWIALYPAQHSHQLIASIRSCDDVKHDSAVYELAMANLLIQSGIEIVGVEPQLGSRGKQPDFLCKTTSGSEFILECADARQLSSLEEGRQKHLDEAINAINEIPGRHHRIWLEYSARPSRAIKKSRLRVPVERWLDSLRPNVDFDSGITLEFEVDGIRFRCRPMKANGRISRVVGAHGKMTASSCNQSVSIRRTLKKKFNKYGAIEKPFVIALNAPTPFRPEEDLFDVLFGSEALVFNPSDIENTRQIVRRDDGLWAGPRGWTNTRISGVLLTGNLGAWSAGMRSALYFQHPKAKMPLKCPFDGIASVEEAGGRIELAEATPIRTVFGLPEGWPG